MTRLQRLGRSGVLAAMAILGVYATVSGAVFLVLRTAWQIVANVIEILPWYGWVFASLATGYAWFRAYAPSAEDE